MASVNVYIKAKAFAGILLLAVQLCNATLPAEGLAPPNPFECMMKCGQTFIQCLMKCGLDDFTCYFSCDTALFKCDMPCFANGTKGDVPPLLPSTKVTGRLQAGMEMNPVTAVAMISPSPNKNSIRGSLQFLQDPSGAKTHIKAIVAGVSPGQLHGMHIEFDSSCSSINGPHFHPENKQHGVSSLQAYRAWCFGNVIADKNGIAQAELSVEEKDIPLNGQQSVLGRSVFVHVDGRVGCGIIETKSSI